jgi:1-acyl-sn-glycerol-3-phosphate acyltransferase
MITFLVFLSILATSLTVLLQLEPVLWKICHWLGSLFNRFKIQGQEHIPRKGAALIVANHVSFIDWLMITIAARRPVRFVMHYTYFSLPGCSFFLKKGKVIPIAGSKEDPQILSKSFDKISEMLNNGELVCIFPEGQLSSDGELSYFRPGIERIVKANPLPVIPIILKGLWGGFFSLKYKDLKQKIKLIPDTVSKTVEIVVLQAWHPAEVTAKDLEEFFKKELRKEKEIVPVPVSIEYSETKKVE